MHAPSTLPSTSIQSDEHAEVTDTAAYPVARLAVAQGQFVKVIATGNAEGMSPVYQCIDADGRTSWLPTRDVIVLDDAAPSPELGKRVLDALTGRR